MNTKLITSSFESQTTDMFIKNIASDPYYVFVGKHTPFTPDDQTPEAISNAIQITTSNAYNNMLFGRRVKTTDVLAMVPRYNWASGTAFAQYENTDEALLTRNFHCVVKTGGYFDVYKCLYNNNGANSTIQPSGRDLQPFTSPSDGYIWKYMYTFSDAIENKFATTDFMPVVANTTIQVAAVPGSIEVIQVLDGGRGYGNHFSGTLRAQDLFINGVDTQYALNDNASNLNQYYTNCIIMLTSGSGVNQYKKIIGYVVQNGQKIITLDSPFSIAPIVTDSYQIYPGVYTTGDGSETKTCDAWAVINGNAGDVVSSVEVLNAGASYRKGTSILLPNATVGVSSVASVSPIISPPNGHGADPATELGANRVCVSVRFSGSEGSIIPTDNDYRTIGLIKRPLFSNVNIAIDYSTQIGTFSVSESISTLRRTKLAGSATVTTGSPTIVGANTDFVESLSLGNKLLITDGVRNLYAPVAAITNATSVTVASNSTWSNTGCTISLVNLIANGILTTANTSVLLLDDVSAQLNDDYLHLIGETTGTTVDISSNTSPKISINGADVGDFDLFVQMLKVTGTLTSGSFISDETVLQNTILAQTASLYNYTAGSPASIYLTNVSQNISTNDNIVGQSSGAVFTPANKYSGSLEVDSGHIMYLENISPITRASNKSETVKIILEF